MYDFLAQTMLVSPTQMLLNDIIKIVKYLEDFGLLIKGVTKIIRNEVKERRVQFLYLILRSSAAALIESMLDRLTGRGAIRAVHGIVKAAQESLRAVENKVK